MLLVVPPVLSGAWRWADIVDAVNETLDLAKQRAVEPSQIDLTAFAGCCPRSCSLRRVREITLVADLAMDNATAFAFWSPIDERPDPDSRPRPRPDGACRADRPALEPPRRPPRSTDFQRAMRAEVRDALWMLCRQWQLGEFEGEDSGSPVQGAPAHAPTPLTEYAPRDAATTPIDARQPLEPRAERRPIALDAGAQAIALDIRLAIGRRWLAMLAADPRWRAFVRLIGLSGRSPAPRIAPDGLLKAHPEAAQVRRRRRALLTAASC